MDILETAPQDAISSAIVAFSRLPPSDALPALTSAVAACPPNAPLPAALVWRFVAAAAACGSPPPPESLSAARALRAAASTGRTRISAATMLEALVLLRNGNSRAALPLALSYATSLKPRCEAGRAVLAAALTSTVATGVVDALIVERLYAHTHLFAHPLECRTCACPLVAPAPDALGVLHCATCLVAGGVRKAPSVAAAGLCALAAPSGAAAAAALRARGKEELRAGNAMAAAETYGKAAAAELACGGGGAHVCLSNRSFALLTVAHADTTSPSEREAALSAAIEAADASAAVAPLLWPKGQWRRVRALVAMGRGTDAVCAALACAARMTLSHAASAHSLAASLWIKGDAGGVVGALHAPPIPLQSSSSSDNGASTSSLLASPPAHLSALELSDDESAAALAWCRTYACSISSPPLFKVYDPSDVFPPVLRAAICSHPFFQGVNGASLDPLMRELPSLIDTALDAAVDTDEARAAAAEEGDGVPPPSAVSDLCALLLQTVEDVITHTVKALSIHAPRARAEARALVAHGCMPLPVRSTSTCGESGKGEEEEEEEGGGEEDAGAVSARAAAAVGVEGDTWVWTHVQKRGVHLPSPFAPIPTRDAVSALQCGICMGTLYSPVALPTCGHTLCRPCTLRLLDHKPACPTCRADASSLVATLSWDYPVVTALHRVAVGIAAPELIERMATIASERAAAASTLPIFVCSLILPYQASPLHVFEPRYRLMMRRALMDGTRAFGMSPHVMGEPGGYPSVGTRLRLRGLRLLPDGRSFVDAISDGSAPDARFTVQSRSMTDGYHVAQIEPLTDADVGRELAAASESASLSAHLDFVSSFMRATTGAAQATSIEEAEAALGPLTDAGERAPIAYGIRIVRQVLSSDGSGGEGVGGGVSHTLLHSDPQQWLWRICALLPVSDGKKYAFLSSTSWAHRLTLVAHECRALCGTTAETPAGEGVGGRDGARAFLRTIGAAVNSGGCGVQ